MGSHAREESLGLPSFAYSLPERRGAGALAGGVDPCMTPQVSKVSGLSSLVRARGAKSPDYIILIRPLLLLRPLQGIQYPRANSSFPMDHLNSPSGAL